MNHNFLWYYWKGVRRAARENWKTFFGEGSKWRMANYAATLGLTAIFTIIFYKSDVAANDLVKAIIVSIPTLCVWFLVSLLLRIAYMPFEVDQERLGAIKKLEKDIHVLNEKMIQKLSITHKYAPDFDVRIERGTVYGIGIYNSATIGVATGVVVKLKTIEPRVLPVPLRLHLRHDNPSTPRDLTQKVDIHAGDIEYFDVVTIWDEGSKYIDQFDIQTIENGVIGTISKQQYRLTILVSSENCPIVEEEFFIGMWGDGIYRVNPKDNPNGNGLSPMMPNTPNFIFIPSSKTANEYLSTSGSMPPPHG